MYGTRVGLVDAGVRVPSHWSRDDIEYLSDRVDLFHLERITA
jgi:hypothetical protein